MLWRQLNVQRCCGGQLTSWIGQQSRRGTAGAAKAARVLDDVPLEQTKPYSALPGPSKLELMRAFMPGGRYKGKPIEEMFLDMQRRYGNIFRMPSVASADVVFTTNPKDYELIFRNEGQYPYRRSFQTFEYYKRVHKPEIYKEWDGLTSGNGPAWGKLRTAVNPILLQPRNAKLYIGNLLQVNNDFLKRLRTTRDPESLEMPDNFAEDIRYLILESIGSVALNSRLGLFGTERDSKEVKLMLESLQRIIELSFELDMMPAFWKYLPVPKFMLLMKSYNAINDFCHKHIEHALQRIEADARAGRISIEDGLETSLLEKLAKFDSKAAVIVAMDLLFAGVEPTLVSLLGILLCVAKNPAQQARLLEEIKSVLPYKDSVLTMDNMKNLPYLRACIKEGIRMYPIGPGTLRRLPHDVVLSGYRILAGTDVGMAANFQMSNSEEFVPRVREFLPERWLRDESADLVANTASPFMYQPFGLGPRSCAGKRIVDMILEIAIARLVRNFEIGFHYPIEDAFKSQFFVKPNISFKFKFVERAK